MIIPSPSSQRSALRILYACAIVTVALYFGRELIVPLVLASLLAFVLAPGRNLLERLRLPRLVAVLVMVVFAFAVIGGLGTVVGRQAAQLAQSLPGYQSTLMEKWSGLTHSGGLLGRLTKGVPVPGETADGGTRADAPSAEGGAATGFRIDEWINLSVARTVAEPLLGPLATGGIVLVFTIFILASTDDLRDRFVRLVGRHDLHRTILAMNDAAGRLSHYFVNQLALNAAFGLLIGMSLWIAGLPNPLLWGILAGLMRFVPFVGVFIAITPPLLIALAVVPGWTLAMVVLLLFIVLEIAMGQVVEPLIYGHSTGLSPLAVIVATAFWALLWGPIGLLIATPLTVCLVVIGRHVEALSFLDVIFGDRPPLTPPETFYQRALEGHALSLAPNAREHILASSRTDYYDQVALPGLALAQGDLARDALAFERLEAIHLQIETLLDKLEADGTSPGRPASPAGDLPAEWRSEGALLCIPGRGQLDDLAARMAVQALTTNGFGARIEQNVTLGAAEAGRDSMLAPRLCCLSVLEEGSSVSGIRYFIRRIQKRMPGAIIVVGLWHADRSSAVLQALRSEGHSEHLVLSIGELLALARALSARGPAAAVAVADTSLSGSRESA